MANEEIGAYNLKFLKEVEEKVNDHFKSRLESGEHIPMSEIWDYTRPLLGFEVPHAKLRKC